MTRRLSFSPYAIGLAVAIAGSTTQYAFARGGRGGGFSRESPAASGSFSSRSGSMQGMERGGEASRQQTATRYHRPYPYAGASRYAWDSGAGVAATGAAVATGAAIGAAAAYPVAAAAATPINSSAAPCAAPAVVPVGGIQYYRCGASWYTEAYAASGPAFVQVAPPTGY